MSRYAHSRPVENFLLVRERDRRRSRELALLLFGLAPVALALLAYTWLQMEILQAGYRIEDLERELEELSRQEQLLALEASYMTSPGRVESAASGELGMVFPSLEQMVFLQARRRDEDEEMKTKR